MFALQVVKNMNKGMENYEKPDFDGVSTTRDIVQNELHCCGVEVCKLLLEISFLNGFIIQNLFPSQNSTDWANTRPDMFTAKQTPDSCCVGGQVLLKALYSV